MAAVALFGACAHAEDLTGRAAVIDGDTIEIHDQRIRLHGG
jgi:endonuclease YncB( thermonuclease family)